MFTQQIIDQAIECPMNPWPGEGHTASKTACAMYYLVLVSRVKPEAKHSVTGELCVDAAIRQINFLVAGGHEPGASVSPAWGHAVVASTMALVKHTEPVYGKLSDEAKERMDWLMKALAIAGNWGYNDANDYRTGFNLLGNFGKRWNPNYRNTYLSVVLSASMYFGAEALDKLYVGFDYETYVARFEELGFTNILKNWTVAGKELMENGGDCILVGGSGLSHMKAGDFGGTGAGVKVPFAYTDAYSGCVLGAENIISLFINLVDFTYGRVVRSDYGTLGTEDYAYILSGKHSPFEGQMGMMTEFAGSDMDGIRSRGGYCYNSFQILVTVYANMKLFGGWDSSTKVMREMDHRMYVGNEDLLFKIREGYHGYSSGKGSDELEERYFERGYVFVKEIWSKFRYC